MLKDIENRRMEGVSMAMVPGADDGDPSGIFWDCYLINAGKDAITNVLITSKGYGQIQGEPRQTSTLRYFYPRIEGEMAVKLEIVPAELGQLTSEYWISFSRDGFMYDRKFLFVEGALSPDHLTQVPVVGRKGVLIS